MNNIQNNVPNPDDIADSARRVGIISFFFGVIFLSVVAIRLAIVYKKYNNGRHCGRSLAGLICGIISLILWASGITAIILWYYLH